MKKKIFLILLLILICGCSPAYAFEETITPLDSQKHLITSRIFNNGVDYKWIYTSSNSVDNGTPEVFRLSVPSSEGVISEATFETTTSSNWTAYISETDNQTTPSSYTVLKFSGVDTTIASPQIPRPRDYVNRDGTDEDYVYLTIETDDPSTGNWTFNGTFPR